MDFSASGYLRTALISRIKRHRAWLPAVLVTAGALFYAVCFTRIYSAPHSYHAASEWIYRNIPAGSLLAEPHWDDRLPVELPRKHSAIYRYLELPLYEADGPAKIAELTRTVSKADYVIFPTQRIQGSLLRVPKEFPFTAAFLRLLYAGQLGYRLEQTVKQRPWFGLSLFDDDLADESFTVYDHPKATIFKNVERLSPEELTRRIREPLLPEVLPSLREVMQTNSVDDAPAPAPPLPWPLQIVLWLLTLEFLAVAAFPIVARAMPGAADGGFGIARTMGLLLVGFAAWACSLYDLAALRAWNLWLLAAALLFTSHLLVSRFGEGWSALFQRCRQALARSTALWYAVFFLFLIFRSFQPEIFWGEKPMDFSFLNYFIRLEYGPPDDPWAAGQAMRYYYFGPFLMALLHKMSAVQPAVGYNLALATLAAMIAGAAFTILSAARRSWRYSVLGAGALLLLSNLAVVWLLIVKKMPLGFDLFWAATRIFTPPGFTEYPLWSLLFGDLHAHVIAEPFALVVLALLVSAQGTGRLLNRILLGLALAALFLLNSWDFITYSAVIGLALLLWAVLSAGPGPRERLRAAASLVAQALVTFGCAFLALLPFLTSPAGKIQSSWGWVQSFEFNRIAPVLGHFGVWLAVIVAAALMVLIRRHREQWATARRLLPLALLLLVPAGLGIAATLKGVAGVPWAILILATVLVGAGLVFFYNAASGEKLETACSTSENREDLRDREQPETASPLCPSVSSVVDPEFPALDYYIAGLLVITAGLLLAATEILFLNDRMNTIFKFYNQLWFLLGVAAICVLPDIIVARLADSARQRLARWAGLAVLTVLLLVSCAGSLINLQVMTSFQRLPGPRPALDGQRYLTADQNMRDELAGYRWINEKIRGTPIMLEAHGDGYREFGRVVMHTGLPVVLGWDHHVSQRGTPRTEIARRTRDIRTIYNTEDPQTALQLLRRYNVELIVVGETERRNYSPSGILKFSSQSGDFKLLFQSGNFALFAPRHSRLTALAPS